MTYLGKVMTLLPIYIYFKEGIKNFGSKGNDGVGLVFLVNCGAGKDTVRIGLNETSVGDGRYPDGRRYLRESHGER